MKNKTLNITSTAMFMALVCIGTLIHIVPAANEGYIHFGDSIIYVAACTISPIPAVIASSFGAALADILSGSAMWAPATIIIKALDALPFIFIRWMYKKKNKKDTKILNLGTVLMLIPASIVTLFGYAIAEAIIFGTKYAILATAVSGWLQPLGSAIVFVLLALALDKINFKSKLQRRSFGG